MDGGLRCPISRTCVRIRGSRRSWRKWDCRS